MIPLQIVLVDDHRFFRSGIASLINKFPQYKILFEAGDGEELTRKLTPKLTPDILLLDINMPGIGGIEACRRIRGFSPGIGIVMITVRDSEEDTIEALEAGADQGDAGEFQIEAFAEKETGHDEKRLTRTQSGVDVRQHGLKYLTRLADQFARGRHGHRDTLHPEIFPGMQYGGFHRLGHHTIFSFKRNL